MRKQPNKKPCTQCGVLTQNGKLCCACRKYFKNGGKVYPLPDFGTVQYTNDDKVVCHICGMAFSKLIEHTKRKHGLNSLDYRRQFGLQVNARLVSNTYHEKMREHTLSHEAHIKNFKSIASGEKRGQQSRLGKKQSAQEIEARRNEQRQKGRLSKTKLTPERKAEVAKIWTKNLPNKK